MSTAAPTPRAVPTGQGGQGALVAGLGAALDLGQARLEVALGVAHRVVGVGGGAQQGGEADGGLPAAAPSAAADSVGIAEGRWPDLAGQPRRR